ncbi:MAG: hypothetical protein ABS59_07925 [Methylobacterium sp. SCN 67-24]|nr:MAG: hypothetical protein ABS59_07925 [Methylobacterium sp. SCN 67-24]
MTRNLLTDGEARRLYDQAALLANLGAWECELATTRLCWTDGVYDLFGLPRGSTLHRPSTVDLYHGESRREMERLRAGIIRSGGSFVLDARIRSVCGEERWMRLTAEASFLHGRPGRIYGTKQNVTREKEMWQGLRRLAYSDPLTGLANRRAFEAEMRELRGHAETGPALGMLALIDLDLFKQINDELGHAAGDECLRQVAARLEATLPGEPLIARIGGDEFAALLCSTAGLLPLKQRLIQTLNALRRPVRWKGRAIDVSATIGATLIRPGRHHDPEQLFAEADSALYVAKAAGRGQLHLFGAALDHAAADATPPGSREVLHVC